MSDALEAAIKKYSEQVAADPKSRAFVPLADAYRKLGRYEEALAVAQDGIQHHPHYLAGKIALARAHFENGDLNEARAIFEEVVPMSPDNLLAVRLLSEIYMQQGAGDRAVPLLERLLKIEPNDERAVQQLETIRSKGAAPLTAPADSPAVTPAVAAEAVNAPTAAQPPKVEPRPPVPVSPPTPTVDATPTTSTNPTQTPTLAELYRSQGHLTMALKVYRDLLEGAPSNTQYAEKISELEAEMSKRTEAAEPTVEPVSAPSMSVSGGGAAADARVEMLNTLWKRIQERRRAE